jgi:hypothetical protein
MALGFPVEFLHVSAGEVCAVSAGYDAFSPAALYGHTDVVRGPFGASAGRADSVLIVRTRGTVHTAVCDQFVYRFLHIRSPVILFDSAVSSCRHPNIFVLLKELATISQEDPTDTFIDRDTRTSLAFQGFLLYVFAVMLLL